MLINILAIEMLSRFW